ncbi:VOC family protein [Agrobacterium tumefaciens]
MQLQIIRINSMGWQAGFWALAPSKKIALYCVAGMPRWMPSNRPEQKRRIKTDRISRAIRDGRPASGWPGLQLAIDSIDVVACTQVADTGQTYSRRSNRVNLIAHVEIPVLDIERAMRFYSVVFDVSFAEIVTIHDNRMAYFPFEEGKDGASGALAEGETYVPTKDGAIIYLGVKNIDDVLERAVQQGSEILFPKTPVDDNLFVAEISDSEGNRIAVQSA